MSAEPGAKGELRVHGPGVAFDLKPLAPPVLGALTLLDAPGEDEDKLGDCVLREGGPEALAGWYFALQRLARRGLVVRSVCDGGVPLATLVPLSPAFPFLPATTSSERHYQLSPFAYLHLDEGRFVLESPRAHARIVLKDVRIMTLIGVLAAPKSARELAESVGGLSARAVSLVLGLLVKGGMTDEPGALARDRVPVRAAWEFHDLVFHARSRKGRSDAAFGATFRGAGRFEPLPAVRPPSVGESYALYRPDIKQLERDDAPFAQVVETRRSGREYAAQPITVRQLGEFLYRVARIRDVRTLEVDTPTGPSCIEVASRPYPSGGAMYELEFYVVVGACDGLDGGLYHYQASDHRLARLSLRTPDVDRLLSDGAASAGMAPDTLQVLVILAARLPRLSWKYSSIAYALMLKHVGVVYQTMYLSATAMGLSACALGGGDSDLFARASGTDYYAETSVGEFLLGSRPVIDAEPV